MASVPPMPSMASGSRFFLCDPCNCCQENRFKIFILSYNSHWWLHSMMHRSLFRAGPPNEYEDDPTIQTSFTDQFTVDGLQNRKSLWQAHSSKPYMAFNSPANHRIVEPRWIDAMTKDSAIQVVLTWRSFKPRIVVRGTRGASNIYCLPSPAPQSRSAAPTPGRANNNADYRRPR